MGSTLHLSPANEDRRARAAQASVPLIRALLSGRGDTLPPKLLLVGRLRVEHPNASLVELGRMCSPPLTKDAVASRLRRLLAYEPDSVVLDSGR